MHDATHIAREHHFQYEMSLKLPRRLILQCDCEYIISKTRPKDVHHAYTKILIRKRLTVCVYSRRISSWKMSLQNFKGGLRFPVRMKAIIQLRLMNTVTLVPAEKKHSDRVVRVCCHLLLKLCTPSADDLDRLARRLL
jgi:hypothetical protein